MLLGLATETSAQYSNEYYHRVGDTIEMRSDIGYYAWWGFEYYYDNNMFLSINGEGKNSYQGVTPTPDYVDSVVVVQRYYTPTPLRVVGLAGSCQRQRRWLQNVYDPLFTFRDTDETKNYFVIYDAMPDSFPLVGKLEWNPFDPFRLLHVTTHGQASVFDSNCCKYNPRSALIPIYEYYFDSAVTVYDSFYVGGTFFGDNFDLDTGIRTGYWSAQSYSPLNIPPCDAAYVFHSDQGSFSCYLDPWEYKTKFGLQLPSYYPDADKNTSFTDAPWIWFSQIFCHFLIYPLIEVDTTVPPTRLCEPVSNVQATVAGTTATVTWDDFPYYSRTYLRYGFGNVPTSQWTEVNVTGNTLHTLSGLEPARRYGVQVMAMCDTSKKETPWSAPVYFNTGGDTTGGDTTGIDGGTMLSRLTFLQPNPAKHEVQVMSSFSLREIDIWTTEGVMVYHSPTMGHEAILDVSWLRAGTYIVAIHTHNGTTHKRLVVTR